MTEDLTLTWTQQLGEELQAQMHGRLLPAHVLHRLARLLSPQELLYVDLAIGDGDIEHFSGRVLVWTGTHLAVLDLTDVLLLDSNFPREDDASVVSLRVLPRAALREISIPPGAGANRSWQLTSSGWPRAAKLTLRYEGLDEQITVPARHPRQGFAELVGTLVNDLR